MREWINTLRQDLVYSIRQRRRIDGVEELPELRNVDLDDLGAVWERVVSGRQTG